MGLKGVHIDSVRAGSYRSGHLPGYLQDRGVWILNPEVSLFVLTKGDCIEIYSKSAISGIIWIVRVK